MANTNREQYLAYQREYTKTKRENKPQYDKEYRERNKEKIRERRKKFREENKELVAAQQRERHKRWYEKNKEKVMENQREYVKKNRTRVRNRGYDYHLKTNYGMPIEEYRKIAEMQEYKCKICSREFMRDIEMDKETKYSRLVVDHNHDTGAIRGLLCHKCNLGLGMFQDDLQLLLKAYDYLKTVLNVIIISLFVIVLTEKSSNSQALGPEHANNPSAHHPKLHASSHSSGGDDEVKAENLGTACTVDKVLKSNGNGTWACGTDNGTSSSASFVTTVSETSLSNEKVLGTAVIKTGPDASKGTTSGIAGGLYFSTDTNKNKLYRDDGSNYQEAHAVADWVQAVGSDLTCGATNAGKIWTYSSNLKFCDNTATPTIHSLISPTSSGTSGQPLLSQGAGIDPAWGTLGLTYGGTNATITAVAGGITYSTASALGVGSAGTTGQALISGGTGAPTWFNPTAKSILFAGTGGILSSDASNFVYDSSSKRVGVGISSPNAALDIEVSSAASPLDIRLQNTSTAASANGVRFYGIADGNNNTGDVFSLYTIKNGGAGEKSWSFGVDTSDSSAFKVNSGATLGATSDGIKMLPSGAVSFPGGILNLPNSGTLPATCTAGDIYVDTSKAVGRKVYYCDSTNTWKLIGGTAQIVTASAIADADLIAISAGTANILAFGVVGNADDQDATAGESVAVRVSDLTNDPVFAPGTLSYCGMSFTGGAGSQTETMTIYVNGAATSVTCTTASATSSSCSDTTHTATIGGSGQGVAVRIDGGGTTTVKSIIVNCLYIPSV